MAAPSAKSVKMLLGRGWFVRMVCLLALAGLAVGANGCSRRFFRKAADKEVNAILAEKDVVPFWKIQNFHLEPDPRARFGAPYDPDRPPMPPDDPFAKDMAPNPQKPGKAGVAWIESTAYLDLLSAWDVENRLRRQLKGQDKLSDTDAYLKVSMDGSPDGKNSVEFANCPCVGNQKPYLITLQQAIELGIINSREFQNRREDLYLTALPLTLERFSFASQFFFTEEAIRERAGQNTTGGPTNRWALTSNTGFTKLFPTGALLVLRFANETVLNLTGTNRHTVSVSNLNFDIVQPLLRGGGKAVTLEGLTQAERNMVYEIRDFARFRKQFYVAIAGGRDALPGSGVTGGFGGGVAVGNIAGVQGPEVSPGTAGRVILATGQAAPVTGYLPTLLLSARVENQKKNVGELEVTLNEFLREQLRGLETQLRVDQVERDLLQANNDLRQKQQAARDSLDRLKLQLGLPVNLPLDLDDGPIRPLTDHLQKYEKTYEEFERVNAGADGFVKNINDLDKKIAELDRKIGELVEKTKETDDAQEKLKFQQEKVKSEQEKLKLQQDYPKEMEAVAKVLRKNLNQLFQSDAAIKGTELQKTYEQNWKPWQGLDDKAIEAKLNNLNTEIIRTEKEFKKKLQDELEKFKGATRLAINKELERKLQTLQREYDWGQFEQTLRLAESQPWLKEKQPGLVRAKFDESFRNAYTNFMILVLRYARSERLEALRQNWPDLPAVQVNGCDVLRTKLEQAEEAVAQVALDNRLDYMNAKAQVVDAWRQIEILANSLLGVFNVRYHLDSTTPPGEAKPLAFKGSSTRHQLILNAELPLVRKAERNSYRASLIGYERARRALMAVQDLIADTTREEVRDLRTQFLNYEVQKQVIHLAYAQVDGARREKAAPPRPGAGDPSSGGNAALTNQLLNAIRGKLQSQDQMYAIWINYQLTRLQLYRDMEMMDLNQRGVWIDEHATDDAVAVPGHGSSGQEWGPAPERLPEPLPLPELLPAAGPGPKAQLGAPQ